MPRDAARPERGIVRWELDLDGEVRTQIGGSGGIHVSSVSFVLRGVELVPGLPLDRTRIVEATHIHSQAAPRGEGDSL
jgi:hypothetical protein